MNLKREMAKNKEQSDLSKVFEGLYTEDESMIKAMHYAKRLAETDCNILIFGETGTGKELFANGIHKLSKRKDSKLVSLNINAIPPNLIESTLFGYKKGAFSGAVSDNQGIMYEANGGTLFLDEIGDLDLSSQVKFLRVIENKEFYPVGSSKIKRSDFRLIAATNKDLQQYVQSGKFREDLFFRLSSGHITLPALHDRGNDKTLIAQKFLQELCHKNQVKKRFTPEALNQLQAYNFPGNVRELKNLVETAFYNNAQEKIDNDCLKFNTTKVEAPSIGDTQLITLEEIKMKHIEHMLKIHKTRKDAAAALGISVRQLYKYIEKYNLKS